MQLIVKHAYLGRIPVFQDYLEATVMIEIGKSECARVFTEIDLQAAGGFSECAIPVVDKCNIARGAVPSVIRTNQFVDRIPTALVGKQWRCVLWRLGHDLTPEESCKFIVLRAG